MDGNGAVRRRRGIVRQEKPSVFHPTGDPAQPVGSLECKIAGSRREETLERRLLKDPPRRLRSHALCVSKHLLFLVPCISNPADGFTVWRNDDLPE